MTTPFSLKFSIIFIEFSVSRIIYCQGSERMEGVDLNIQSEGAFINKG